ncbi:hypothetical protein Pelo_10944 [Pelomyxa schiedti]|nr:hypothetical protein Pelo_10944 [Pelomyxa schiedti]
MSDNNVVVLSETSSSSSTTSGSTTETVKTTTRVTRAALKPETATLVASLIGDQAEGADEEYDDGDDLLEALEFDGEVEEIAPQVVEPAAARSPGASPVFAPSPSPKRERMPSPGGGGGRGRAPLSRLKSVVGQMMTAGGEPGGLARRSSSGRLEGPEERALKAKKFLLQKKGVGKWVSEATGSQASEATLDSDLADGRALCNLANKIKENSVSHIRPADDAVNTIFDSLHNAQAFLNACQAFGLAPSDLFLPCDLISRKNLPRVVGCLAKLGHIVSQNHFTPEYTDADESSLTPEEIQQAEKLTFATAPLSCGHDEAEIIESLVLSFDLMKGKLKEAEAERNQLQIQHNAEIAQLKSSFESDKDRLAKQNEEYKEKQEVLRSQLDTAEKELAKLKSETASHVCVSDTATEDKKHIDDLLEKSRGLGERLSTKCQELDAAEKKLAQQKLETVQSENDMRSKLEGQGRQLESATNELEELKKRALTRENSLQEQLNTKSKELDALIKQMENQKEQAEKSAHGLQTQITALSHTAEQELQQVRQELQQRNESLADHQAAVQTLERKTRELDQQSEAGLRELTKKLQDALRELAARDSAVKDLRNEKTNVESELTKLRTLYNNVIHEKETSDKAALQQRELADSTVVTLKQQCEKELAQKKKEFEKEMLREKETFKKEIEKHREVASQRDHALQQREQHLKSVESKAELGQRDAENQKKALLAKQRELQDKLQHASHANEQLTKQHEELTQKNTALARQVQELRMDATKVSVDKQKAELANLLDKARQDLEKEKKQAAKLRTDLATSATTITQLRQDTATKSTTSSKENATRENLDNYKKTILGLQNDNSRLIKEVQDAKAQLQQVRTQTDIWKTKYNTLMSDREQEQMSRSLTPREVRPKLVSTTTVDGTPPISSRKVPAETAHFSARLDSQLTIETHCSNCIHPASPFEPTTLEKFYMAKLNKLGACMADMEAKNHQLELENQVFYRQIKAREMAAQEPTPPKPNQVTESSLYRRVDILSSQLQKLSTQLKEFEVENSALKSKLASQQQELSRITQVRHRPLSYTTSISSSSSTIHTSTTTSQRITAPATQHQQTKKPQPSTTSTS